MSFVRRLALGVPAAGATAFAAFAIASPSLAVADTAAQAGHPVVMASPDRGGAGYASEAPATAPPTTVPATTAPTATTVVTTAPPATVSPDVTGGTRGHAGYPSESPQPSGNVKSVPGLDNESVPPSKKVTTKGAGVSSGSLPLTGGPVGATIGVGAMLVAGGAGALWYTRRRKTA